MWLKFRHKWSASRGEWQWQYLGTMNGVSRTKLRAHAKEIARELADENDYSEHYRGIDYRVFRKAPKDVIERFVKDARDMAKSWQRRTKELEKLLGAT